MTTLALPLEPTPPQDVAKADPDDARLWSVTTIIGALDRPALMYWAAEQAAICAIDEEPLWQAMLKTRGREDTVRYLRDARFRRPKDQRSASELGTAVHDACEAYALTGTKPEVDDEVRPYLEQFDGWAQRFQPEYEAAEMTVYSDFGYAGTLDAILTVRGQRVICDYKSTRKPFDDKGNPSRPWPEVALQLAAYRHADWAATWRPRMHEIYRRRYYLLGPSEREAAVRVPEVDGGICLQITPASCIAYPIRCDRVMFEQFLYTLEAARFVFELAKGVVGEPLL